MATVVGEEEKAAQAPAKKAPAQGQGDSEEERLLGKGKKKTAAK